MKRAQDAIPQRQLVRQLALAIDLCMVVERLGGKGFSARSSAVLVELLDANPRSAYSTHVLHNIGSRRSRWLLAARDARADATSS